jgi:hypothetical protein
MRSQSDISVSWQAVAIELLRRLCGASPRMSTSELRAAGAEHEAELFDRGIDGLYFAACDVEHPRWRVYQALRSTQIAEARLIIEDLKKHGRDAAVLKSIEIGARYPGALSGSCGDIDLLISADGLWDAEKVLYGRGYARCNYDAAGARRDLEPRETYRRQAMGYELMPFSKCVPIESLDEGVLARAGRGRNPIRIHDGAVLAIVYFDIHHNILFDFDVAPLLARTVASALGTGRTLCPADHLWFLIHRHYFEVAVGWETMIRVLAPIAAIANDPAVEWTLVIRNAVDQNAAAPCLYWLTFFRRLGAPRVPDGVLEELRSHLRTSDRRWGWQLERLFDLDEPFPDSFLSP